MLIELMLETGRYRDAIAKLKQLGRASWPGEPPSPDDPPPAAAAAREAEDTAAAAAAAAAAAGAEATAVALRAPLEIAVKEGVCYARLGDLRAADALWAPLMRREGRADECVDLLYEVAIAKCDARQWRAALALLQEVDANPLYKGTADLRAGECLIALGRKEEASAAFERAFDHAPKNAAAALAMARLLLTHGEARRALHFLDRHLEAVRAAAPAPSAPATDVDEGALDGDSLRAYGVHYARADEDVAAAAAADGAADEDDDGATIVMPVAVRPPPPAADVRVAISYIALAKSAATPRCRCSSRSSA